MSWVLTAFLLAVLYLTGKKMRIGWMVGIISQAIWVWYSITTKQYGFLIGALLVGGMYIKNWIDWAPDRTTKFTCGRCGVTYDNADMPRLSIDSGPWFCHKCFKEYGPRVFER